MKGLKKTKWLNKVDAFKDTLLIKASKKGHVEVVKALIQAGADLNVQDFWGYTSLMWASGEGYSEVVRILIQAGAEVNLQDEEGGTALMYAAECGHEEVIKALIQAGADPKILNQEKETAKDKAKKTREDCVVELLEVYEARQALSQVINPLEKSLSLIQSSERENSPSSKAPRL